MVGKLFSMNPRVVEAGQLDAVGARGEGRDDDGHARQAMGGSGLQGWTPQATKKKPRTFKNIYNACKSSNSQVLVAFRPFPCTYRDAVV